MSNAIAEAFVRVRPDTKSFESEASAGVGGALKKVAGIAAAAFAGVKVAGFLGDSIAEGREAAKVLAQTEAVIKSTGGTAGITAGHVDKLATSISNMTGIDDEAIASAENLLLTFTNIKNNGPDKIFDRATQAAVDMAAALGGDAAGQSIALGKALNDPIKGITALTRVGVSFDEQQKKNIKSMVEAGNTAGAQKVILDELAKEFGGQAAAQATAADKAKVAWGNFKEEIGTRLIPIIDRAAVIFTTKLLPALDSTFAFLARVVPPIINEVVGGFRALFAAFRAGDGDITSNGFAGVMERIGLAARSVVDFFVSNWPQIREIAGKVFETLASIVTDQLIPAFRTIIDIGSQIFNVIRDNWQPIAAGLGAMLVAVVVPAVIGLGVALASAAISMLALISPAVLLVAGIGALVAGVVYAYQNFETFRAVVDAVLQAIQVVWNAVWPTLRDTLVSIFDAMKVVVETTINVIRDIINIVLGLLHGDWGRAWDGIKQLLSDVWEAMKALVGVAIDYVRKIISDALDVIVKLWQVQWEAIKLVLSTAWDLMKSAVSTGVAAVVQFFTDMPGKILFALSTIGQSLYDLGNEILGKMKSGIDMGWGAVRDFFSGLPNTILDFLIGLPGKFLSLGASLMQNLINGIKMLYEELKSWVGKVLSELNPLNHLPSNPIPSFVPIIGKATGGTVPAGQPFIAGEQGPELITPSSQSRRVFTASDTASMLGGRGGGGDVTIDARMIVEGNVIGDSHLTELFDEHRRQVVEAIQLARRTGAA